MKRKIADIMTSSEPRDQFHKILQTKADKQFTLDTMFSANATTREKERAKARKLFVQAPVASTSSPALSAPLDKTSAAYLSDAEMKILGMEKTAGMARIRRIGMSAVRKGAFTTGTAGKGLDNAAEVAGMKLERRMARYPGGEAGYVKAHGLKEPKGEVTKETATALVNQFRPNRAAKVSKLKEVTASVAPHVDAWFEKNASSFLSPAQLRYPELLKAAADTKTVPNLKRGPATASATRGAVPTRSSLSGGAA
jgi:hypothetical protein